MTSPRKELQALDENTFDAACVDLAMILFSVDWSASCRMQISMIENVEKVFSGKVVFGYADIEKNPGLRERFNIEDVPTTIVLEKGVEIKRFAGLQRGKWLADYLNELKKFFVKDSDFRRMWMELQDKEEEKILHDKSILIVDDNPDTSFCIRTILEEAGFGKISLASGSREALDNMKTKKPDLVFLSLKMKDKEGFRTMKEIRRSKELSAIPLLVSVGPTNQSLVFEEAFKDATILKQGEQVHQPKNRISFIGLVQHMLMLEGSLLKDQPAIVVDSYCPVDTSKK